MSIARLTQLGRRGEDPFVSMAHKSYGRMRAGSFIAATFPEGEVDVTVQQSLLFLVPTIPKTVTVSVVRGSQSYVKVDQVIDAIGVTEGASSPNRLKSRKCRSTWARRNWRRRGKISERRKPLRL